MTGDRKSGMGTFSQTGPNCLVARMTYVRAIFYISKLIKKEE